MHATEVEVRSDWHELTAADAVRLLDVDGLAGLSSAEATARRERYGPNRLPEGKRKGPIERFLLQFHNVLIYVLLAAAVVTLLLGHLIDTGVILAVVVVNAVIGFIQEGKAEKALAAIRSMLSVEAVVTRDGQRATVPAEDLVPGDLVHLKSGDKIPADLRLVKSRSLRIEEAALTGESQPVEKSVAPAPADAVLGDRTSMCYSGTLVTYGQATGVVVATGAQTELGRINELVAAAPTLVTPLLRQVARFGHALTIVILGLAALVLPFAVFVRDYSFGEAFLAVVGLAVAAIPEGLPAIMTITLAIGVQAMARRRAIIRRLPAVETLGSVTVICSDKTGTLTRNEMTVTSVVTASHRFDVSGVGYQPQGEFTLDVDDIAPADHPPLVDLARVGLLCNDTRVRESGGEWKVEGDPTEGALVVLGRKAGLDPAGEAAGIPGSTRCRSSRSTSSWRRCTTAPTAGSCSSRGRRSVCSTCRPGSGAAPATGRSIAGTGTTRWSTSPAAASACWRWPPPGSRRGEADRLRRRHRRRLRVPRPRRHHRPAARRGHRGHPRPATTPGSS
jgi:magnesium-transporting ATPase (P-type)